MPLQLLAGEQLAKYYGAEVTWSNNQWAFGFIGQNKRGIITTHTLYFVYAYAVYMSLYRSIYLFITKKTLWCAYMKGIHAHLCAYTRVHTHTHTQIHTKIDSLILTHLHKNRHSTDTLKHMCMHTDSFKHTHTHAHTHTRTHTRTHTHPRTHTHRLIWIPREQGLGGREWVNVEEGLQKDPTWCFRISACCLLISFSWATEKYIEMRLTCVTILYNH